MISKYIRENELQKVISQFSPHAINTVLGLEYDTSYNASSIAPTGINGLTSVNLESDYDDKRAVIGLGFEYDYDQEKNL